MLSITRKNINPNTVKYLVENKADIHAENNFYIRWASEYGHLDIVKYLVDNKADIHAENNYSVRLASYNGHLETVKYLVENNANIHSDDKSIILSGCSVVLASQNDHFDVVRYLIDNKADIHAGNDFPVSWASIRGNFETVKYLVENKADISEISDKHRDAIFGIKILKFWRNQRKRKRLIRIRNILIPIYYSPSMKGGYFAKKNLERYIDTI